MAAPAKSLFLRGLAENGAAQKVMASWLTQYAVNAGVKMPAVGAAQSLITDLSNNLAAMVDKRPDLRNSVQVYVTGTYGVTRLQEKGVVQAICN